MYELTVVSTFSSAHNLRGYEGSCENLHGHNWRVEAVIASPGLDKLGMVMDFKKLKESVNKTLDSLDHRYLNEVPPFDRENATAENLARFIYKELSKALGKGDVSVLRVRVWESDTSAAAYYE